MKKKPASVFKRRPICISNKYRDIRLAALKNSGISIVQTPPRRDALALRLGTQQKAPGLRRGLLII